MNEEGPVTARRRAVRLGLTVFLIAAFFADFYTEPAGARYLYLPLAVLEQGTLEISSYLPQDGRTITDVSRVGNRYFSGTYPGTSACLLPAILVARAIETGTSLSSSPLFERRRELYYCLIALLLGAAPVLGLSTACFSLFLSGRGVTGAAHTLWTLGLVLGTPIIYYAAHLHEAPFVLLVEIAILSLALPPPHRSFTRRHAALVGLCLGLLRTLNPLGTLVCGAAAGVLLWRQCSWRNLAAAAAGFLPVEMALRGYFWAVYGSPMAQPFQYSNGETIAQVWASYDAPGLAAEILRCVPEILWGMTFGIRGVFLFAPLMLLTAWRLLRSWNQAPTQAAVAAYLVNQVFLLGFIHGIWAGGTSWGPRYLMLAFPWLIAGAALAGKTARSGDRALRGFAGISLFITWLGLQFGTANGVLAHLYYLMLGGPTTPVYRYLSFKYGMEWLPEKIAAGMAPSWSGQYFALTHINAWFAYLVVAGILWLVWRPRRDER